MGPMTSTVRASCPAGPGGHRPGCACDGVPDPRFAGRTVPWLAPLGVGIAALAGCVALGLTDMSDRGGVLCPFRAMTGLDCPGCGMTRGLAQLVKGHPASAVDYNLALVLAVPVVVYLYVTWLAAGVGLRLPALRIGGKAYLVLGALFGVFSVLRNLNIGPGRYLNSDPQLS